MKLRPFFDAHAHPQTDSSLKTIQGFLKEFPNLKICAMGTQPSDWDMIRDLYALNPDQIVPCFGYHPWFAYKIKENEFKEEVEDVDWKCKLESYLHTHPNSILGEFGLDKVATTPEPDKPKKNWNHSTYETTQKPLFQYQFDLATKLRRPISLHVVKTQGPVFDFFKERIKKIPSKRSLMQDANWKEEELKFFQQSFPPAIMLHSFSGTREMAMQFLGLRFIGNFIFFSFSKVINARSLDKFRETIKTIPDDKILIESDLGDIESIPNALLSITELISEVKGWTFDETIERTSKNALSFIEYVGK